MLRVLAGLFFGRVWVIGVGDHCFAVGVVVESVAHETTIASIVACGGAVDELLLRESVVRSSGDLVERLKLGNSGEGPAGTAAALVLDIADGAADTPVNTTVLFSEFAFFTFFISRGNGTSVVIVAFILAVIRVL